MKKTVLAMVLGCVMCGMMTGCGDSVIADSGVEVVSEEKTVMSTEQMATGVSAESVAATTDVFDSAIDFTDLKTVGAFGEEEDELLVQVFSGAEKKLLENSFAYSYKFEGGKYTVEISPEYKKNVSATKCDWVTMYAEVNKYFDGSKFSKDVITKDITFSDSYEVAVVKVDDSAYNKNSMLLENVYFIKNNATGTISMISVAVERDKTVYGVGDMPAARNYLDAFTAVIYSKFVR